MHRGMLKQMVKPALMKVLTKLMIIDHQEKHTEETTDVTWKKLTQDYFSGDFNNKIKGDTLLVLMIYFYLDYLVYHD